MFLCTTVMYKYSQTCIWMALQGDWKCALSEQFLFMYRFKLYVQFINGKDKVALYSQWFKVSFKAGSPVHHSQEWSPLRQVLLYITLNNEVLTLI
jgi:hypothetical protein